MDTFSSLPLLDTVAISTGGIAGILVLVILVLLVIYLARRV